MNRKYVVFCFFLPYLASCGISLGNQAANSPVPTNATALGQGNFSGAVVNNVTISGNAIVYALQNSDGTLSTNYILRLASFSAPTENGLSAVVSNGSTTAATIALTNYSGSMNYSFSFTGSNVFNTGQVTIHSNLHNLDYSEALLR